MQQKRIGDLLLITSDRGDKMIRITHLDYTHGYVAGYVVNNGESTKEHLGFYLDERKQNEDN